MNSIRFSGHRSATSLQESNGSTGKSSRGTTADYYKFVQRMVDIEPALQFVVDFLGDQSSQNVCEKCPPVNGTVIAFANEHSPKIQYRNVEDDVCLKDSHPKLASALQDSGSRRKLLICEDLRPFGALVGVLAVVVRSFLMLPSS